ncbi:hypothetical protein AMATHDRAFT_6365 [Amanita thiersii Skay4041]|uniref:Uncharacterized protein n=1 Tax=Amanita thiersii Skay4041 TaxID=703135 RepID=A0A2A9NJE9_9AGAR|nr:hypothetical protein AMATHDRAFT_6365 [Amanita thiersii Skay4041]
MKQERGERGESRYKKASHREPHSVAHDNYQQQRTTHDYKHMVLILFNVQPEHGQFFRISFTFIYIYVYTYADLLRVS